WPELSVLADAGLREESSTWRNLDRSANSALTRSALTRSPLTPSKAPFKPALTPARKLSEPEPVPDPSKALQLPPATVDEFLFDLLVSGRSGQDLKEAFSAGSQPNPLPSVETRYEVIQTTQSTPSPAGMIDRPALARLLEANKSFTGVAVSICINEEESS